jgi:hypothetical protein
MSFSLSKFPVTVAVLGLSTAPVCADTLLSFDFNTGHPWLRASSTDSRGVVSAITRDNNGTIGNYQGSPTAAMTLRADFSRARGKAKAALSSGVLDLKNSETNLAKLTLGFDVWMSELRPVRVIVKSFDANGKLTGSRFAAVLPPVKEAWYRFSLDLDKTKPLQGRFNPRAPKMQLVFELNDDDRPLTRAANQVLRVDNVSFAAPTFYVSVKGSDAANGRSEQTAFATIQKAIDAAGAGDVICVMDGQYTSDNVEQIVRYTKNGSPARWIVMRANPGHKPELRTTGWNGIRINDAGSYFEIRDLIVRGRRRELKLEEATADGLIKTKNGKAYHGDPKFNSNGISIQSTTKSQTARPHHIRVLNNTVVDNPGGGISAIGCDYVTIENNRSVDNCHFMRYAGSGISVFRSWDFDQFKGYKIFVVGNTTHGNRCFVPWTQVGKISDGNGIIVDDNRNRQAGASQVAYEGRTLVQNNLSYGNGGSGIHAYSSRFVDIVNNTAYHNALSPELNWSQIFAGGRCTDIRLFNNVMHAPKGKPLDLSTQGDSTGIIYANNLYFGDGDNNLKSSGGLGVEAGSTTGDLSSNVQADPKFVRPSLDPAVADFRLAPGSPGIDAANAQHPAVPLNDILGHMRPQGAALDKGAYEFPATP